MLAGISYTPLVSIDAGPLSVTPHGIMAAVGILVGIRYMLPAAARRGVETDRVVEVLTWALPAAILGARLGYVINHAGDYAAAPWRALLIWEGGLSLLAGIVAGVAVGALRLRRAGIAFWDFTDAAAPGLALGIAVGRLGDLAVGDHLGKPTTFFLGYQCSPAPTASPCVAPGGAVHMTALYDLIGALAVFAVLVLLQKSQMPRSAGTLVFAAGYGTVRFVEGFFRLDVTHGTGLNVSQWTAAIITPAALVALAVVLRRQHARRPPASTEAVAAPASPEAPATRH